MDNTSNESKLEILKRLLSSKLDTSVVIEESEWKIEIEDVADFPSKLPKDAVIIGNNGYGDVLIVQTNGMGTISNDTMISIYRHEEGLIEALSMSIGDLLMDNPAPSTGNSVYYYGTKVRVELGDEVVARDIFFKRNGRVVYVPGISPLNTEFEYGGIKWIGIRFDKGSINTAVIDLKTGEVDKSVKFIKRNKKEINELKPNFRFM